MPMTTTITSPAIFLLFTSSSYRVRTSTPPCHLPISRSAFFRPNSAFKQSPRSSPLSSSHFPIDYVVLLQFMYVLFAEFEFVVCLLPRLRISQKASTFSKHRHFVPFCCSSNPGVNPGTTDESSKESTIDLQLPRRSLLVQFTCDACGERTKRLINRLAYERGTVFVQCSGCLQHHKLVDNLGLVVEYDFRTETIESED
ncbi:hypothetical protein Cgig2_010751 [Carnegiea gigantea]|uniref:DNL-type domain-containing protein n=1 Tax=Carnegiea gigantea TaxID=171969 RepID=A0A9Q1QJX3_9CARY|nr:hypothetical protein Cgig2_010751 [Carnegiea gigantea]